MGFLEVLAVAPAGRFDPNLAIAGCRAGAIGLLNVDGSADFAQILDGIERLSRSTHGTFGLAVAPDQLDELRLHSQPADGRTRTLLLTGPLDKIQRAEISARFPPQDQWRVLLEAIDEREMRRAIDWQCGVVLKGNEAGGRVGKESTFVLLQRWGQLVAERPEAAHLAVFARGGIGLRTAAACRAAGATGVVLDAQLLLARESSLSESARQRVAAFDGSETVAIGEELGAALRLWSDGIRCKASKELANDDDRIRADSGSDDEKQTQWQSAVRRTMATAANQSLADPHLLLVGQDVAFARTLADRFVTVGGIVQAIQHAADAGVAMAKQQRALAPNGEMARRNGARYPILQGPMTRVSDTAPFAHAVASAGGLPFLALALLRKPEVEPLLAETKRLLDDRPWGVGVLGFVPPEIRKEQIDCVLAHKPPFAIIAGGRPDQAKELEAAGIATYLHVPAPGLLKMFLKDGAKRFIFEGRECGGHVGPRSSFVLWETMVETILDHLGPSRRGEDLAVAFAGGIHDGLSAAMAAAIAAPLVERGIAVGVLLGTAYLFTQEAVAGKAIVERFQSEALHCRNTVLLQTGPGHAIRCIDSPYFQSFETERRRLRAEGKSHEEIVRHLEWMNLGRLRLASKGVERSTQGATAELVDVDEAEQFERGMYMIGQVAGLRDRVVSMADLHADVSEGGVRHLEAVPTHAVPDVVGKEAPCDIAIVGMSCFYPKALDLGSYWANILDRKNAVTEVPASHWDWRLFYDADPRKPDKIISKWGGFLEDLTFDPLEFGITPTSVAAIEPLQFYLLEGVKDALADAGYAKRPFDRSRTCAILGIGGGGSPLGVSYGFRTCIPLLETVPGLDIDVAKVEDATYKLLPTWSEDSFPGILMNVAVGRVANRFDFGGTNYAIDAACASSLAAVHACIRELEAGTSDVAVAMGADSVQTPYAYMCFSKTHALSATGRCRPFDASADGIVLSEGIGIVILKRLADAERDGDRIYAVIKGIGASSDGKAKGLTAPRREGQALALERAYAKAGISAATVELVEAHGTGTVVGDQTEAQTISDYFKAAGAPAQSCAIGSVKSMIGHSKCAAGIAGLIKTALAVRTKTLPPTLVERRNAKGDFERGPLYLNTRARPWLHRSDSPRRAGVSAFGFGGTNFHAVLEEYRGDLAGDRDAAHQRWPAELIVLRRADRKSLAAAVDRLRIQLKDNLQLELAAVARAAWRSNESDPALPALAVVATDLADLKQKLGGAAEFLKGTECRLEDPRGVYCAERPAEGGGKIAFLFPGQGSQYVDMLADLALAFPAVRATFERADEALAGAMPRQLSRFIFPPSPFSVDEENAARLELTRTEIAQPAIGAASLAIFRLLESYGVRPDFLAGHSYGEYAALAAANAMDEASMLRLSRQRGLVLAQAADARPGAMAALDADAATAAALLEGIQGAVVANVNAPAQTVVSGYADGIDAVLARCQQRGVRAQKLSVACGFHSPHVAGAAEPWARELAAVQWSTPTTPIYSNLTAAPHEADPARIQAALVDHLTHPVLFADEMVALHDAGARTFIEIGPAAVLTGLVRQTLADRDHVAIALDVKNRNGLTQLCHALAQMAMRGIAFDHSKSFAHRAVQVVDFDGIERDGFIAPPKSAWIINSVRSRPIDGPEPLLIGQVRQPRRPVRQQPEAHQPARTHLETQQPTSVAPPVGAQASEQNGVAHGRPAVHPAASSDAGRVMLQFQDLMSKFLDTQKSVMHQYLSAAGRGQASEAVVPAPPPIPYALPAASTNGHSHPKPAPGAASHVQPAAAPEPAHATPVPAAAAVAESPAIDRPWLEEQLLELICKRTGYPKDMIGHELDLEADLGIDSIKRVEILGTLAESLGAGNADAPQDLAMEKLTAIKTLRGILDYLEPIFAKPHANGIANGVGHIHGHQSNGVVKVDAAPTNKKQHDVQRALVRLIDAPLPPAEAPMLPAGATVIVDDGRGVARAVAARLADFGQDVVVVRHAVSNAASGDFAVDLCEPKAVAGLVERLRHDFGQIGGLIDLLPLAEPGELSAYDRAYRDTRSLYTLAKQLEPDLRAAGKAGSALCWAATGMGGAIGFEGDGAELGQGGPIGFLKCLAFEWPEVVVRAIDVDPSVDVQALAETILSELTDRDGPLEVGRQGARRVTWEPVAAPLERTGDASIKLDADSTVLITGGARGITATIALELANRFSCNLCIVGRSAEPDDEAEETRALTEPAALKAALMKRLEREGRMVAPAAVESSYRRLLADREVRGNLAKLRRTKASIHYYSVDVREDAAFGALLTELNKRFGGIDAVLHGAGVIEDKLVRDKSPESFDRVFETKVRSALLLAERLDPARLKAMVLFSSIASRYGNKGQSDYAAANETLSKLAHELDRRWTGRVLAIAWGPWSDVGMVVDLQKHLVQRGLKLIAPTEGPRFVLDELQFGHKGESEVIVAGGADHMARPERPKAVAAV